MPTLGEVKVAIGADVAGLNRGLKLAVDNTKQSTQQMQQSLQTVSKETATMGRAIGSALATIGLTVFSKHLIDSIDRLNDLANQLGVSTEAMSQLQYAAKLSGTSLEQVSAGLKFLGNNVSDAAVGMGTAKETLKALNIDAKQLATLPLDQQFEKVADALNGVSNQADKIAMVRDLFGRMGVDILPLINDFKDLKAEADAVGYTISEDTAQRFAMLNDEIDRMTMGSEVMARNFLQLVVPALTDTIAGVNELFAGMQNTSKLFNNLAAGGIRFGETLGLVDKDVAQAAMEIAGENIEQGQEKRKPRLKVTVNATPSSRSAKSGGKKEQTKAQEEQNSALDEYLRKLGIENDLMQLSARDREIQKNVIEAQNAAMKDGTLLTEEQIGQVQQLSAANYDMEESQKKVADAMREAQQEAVRLREQLTDGLTDIILHFDSAGDAARKFFDEIASQILKKQVTGPLAGFLGDAIGGIFGGSGGGFSLSQGLDNAGAYLGLNQSYGPNLQGFAGGGDPPVGVPSIVGENGPEVFVPKTAGTIIPNHAMGGQQIIVQQTFHISPGIQGTVRAELMQAMPGFVVAAKNAVIEARQKGGSDARALGARP